ncbi:DNA-binding IclR family transcriptional regulator [Rhodococcus sp. SMB37]|uniref:IclR family transcriptional regulator n=1 Tax=Rhodococcus sp. SMB37 TaxID=2512213 RepID=UPI0010444EFF|nr:helix-turn-helix domain-containing protein [Rhodococcus sp. SMB37]TCN50806.1 DNA-binding IclR family transcriptional regulator [Rhodococcus sp. SMB37]
MTTSNGRQQPAPQVGSRTLARGLTALLAVVDSPDGMTVQRLAAELDVHRSIAYRILQTLRDFGFVTHGSDGSYRPGALLAALSTSYLPALREIATPVMRRLADQAGCTVHLFVVEGEEAVSIEVVEPVTVLQHIAFRAGMRTPLDRGAAGYALLAAGPALPGEPEVVVEARRRGYATSSGEVESGAYAVAAPIANSHPAACLTLMSHRENQLATAAPEVVRAAEEIASAVLEG